MPVGYLIPVALIGWGVACALTSWRALGPAAGLPALLVDELPFITGLWLLASTALALSDGDTRTVAGKVVLLAAVLAGVGLVVVVLRALRAHAALGNDGSPHRPWARIVRAPLLAGRRDVTWSRGLAYGAGPRHRADVCFRRDRPTGRPVLVHFHGGGFRSGSRSREAKPLMRHLSAQGGLVCVSAGYRLQPHVQLADQVADVHAALAWVRAHAAGLGGDPRRLVLTGSSAGAYLALQAVLDGEPDVVAVVGRYGYYGRLAPSSDLPPLLLIHGDHDVMVPASWVRDFAERARSVSKHPVVYRQMPGAHHDFDLFESIRAAAVAVAVEQFIGTAVGDG